MQLSIENINVQLHLLPHTSEPSVFFPEYFDGAKAWKVEDSKKFINLPVAHQLTTPHVAKYYAQLDEKGRYIKFGDNKKYFPNVILYTIQLTLLLEEGISYLITGGVL